MIRRTPRATRPDTLFPYTPPVRSALGLGRARRQRPPRLVEAGKPVRQHVLAPDRNGERILAIGALIDEADFHGWNTSWTGIGRPETSRRSEEHTSELQSLMRISYAVFCLKKIIIITSVIITH